MASYAVYDEKTGEIVHLHVEPVELDTPHAEILQLVDPKRVRSLHVVRVPKEGLPAEGARVVNGELQSAGEGVDSGAAGAGIAGGTIEPAVERRYEIQRPRSDTSGRPSRGKRRSS
jgi:hypothetical protein